MAVRREAAAANHQWPELKSSRVAMAVKLIESAYARWRAVNAPLVALGSRRLAGHGLTRLGGAVSVEVLRRPRCRRSRPGPSLVYACFVSS
jgi:hypothetical protein